MRAVPMILRYLLISALIFVVQPAKSQFLMDMIDTTKEMGKGLLNLYQKYDKLRISGYIQPQYQVASEPGIKSYEGGDFPPNSNNRFMLRRGRIKFDYVHFSESPLKPSVQFVFQFDGTERGVFIRDFWGRIFENNWKLLAFTTGMFARPFGFETNLSSSDRESPERGRMNQILMKTERDLGAMLSFEPRNKNSSLRNLKFDIGVFNGQGLTAAGDFDSYKDFVTRLNVKPYSLSKKVLLSAGVSMFYGGLRQNLKYVYEEGQLNGKNDFVIDSSSTNIGRKLPRQYYGADIQLKFLHRWGATELRGEFIGGKQTAFANSSETPGSQPGDNLVNSAYYVRPFNGAYFYFLQNIINTRHQLIVKYDWYDPNTSINGKEIGAAGTNFHSADVRYDTWGFGYIYYMTENVKWVFYYAKVKNETTQLAGYTQDIPDNVFTCRLQFRF